MSVNIRFPNITALSEKEQIAQIKSYLHQLVQELNYALPTIQTASTQTYEVQGGEMSYYELRSLIMKELQEVESLFDQLSTKMQSEYIKNEELPRAIEAALADAKESGEFKGEQGVPGADGEDGFSPVITITDIEGGHQVTITDKNGTQSFDVLDRNTPFTDEEVETIATKAARKISFTLDEEGNLYYEVEE